MTTVEKVQRRILAALPGAPSVYEAAKTAAFEAVQEAKDLGWSDRTQAGIVATFATVAADMIADALQAAERGYTIAPPSRRERPSDRKPRP